MSNKSFLVKLIIVSSAVGLGYINFKQGYKSIITFMKDNNIILFNEAVFNRIFINTDFIQLEYMEGNSLFHFISPFIFYSLSIFWGSCSFLMIKKNYHQFVHSRTRFQKESLKIIRGNYIIMTALFNFAYVLSVLFFIYFSELSFNNNFIELLTISLMIMLSSTLISIGISSLSFYFYLKYDEVFSQLFNFIVILSIFIVDIKWDNVSIVFIDSDKYFIGGILTGIGLIIISLFLNKTIKYEIE